VEYTIGYIANKIGGKVIGEKEAVVTSICPPDNVKANAIVFVKNKRCLDLVDRNTKPLFIVLDFYPELIKGINYIVIDPEVKDEAFIKLLLMFDSKKPNDKIISEKASVSEDAVLGDNVSIKDFVIICENNVIGDETQIGSNSYIGENCRIGKNCIIHQNVTVYPNTIIEDNVILYAGAVIGSDGFGYSNIKGINRKIPQIGGVYIEKNVEIGANSTVDRSTIRYTRIGENTKIDNLVHIGHNVKIGKNTVICALCGISGSVKIGDNVIIAGAVGIKDHVIIEDNVTIGAKSGVMDKVIKKGKKILGTPSIGFRSEMEFIAIKPRLKQMYFDVRSIKKKLGL